MHSPRTVNHAGQVWRPQHLGDLSADSPPTELRATEIWFAELREFAALLASPTDLALLTEDERQRAARMSAPVVREDFLLSRILLRRLLGARCGVAGERLAFLVNEHGKPALQNFHGVSLGSATPHHLQFNLSHCRGAWLLGISPTAAIGVDIERPRRVAHALRLATRVFTAAERAALIAAREAVPDELNPDETRDAHFLRCWTRKEAVLKAAGSGFAWPAGEIEVSTSTNPMIVSLPRAAGGDARVCSLQLPVPGFAAWALFGGDEFPAPRCYRLQP